MNWLVTKGFKHDKQQDRFVEDPNSSLVGLSEMSNNGFVISGKVTVDTCSTPLIIKPIPISLKSLHQMMIWLSKVFVKKSQQLLCCQLIESFIILILNTFSLFKMVKWSMSCWLKMN